MKYPILVLFLTVTRIHGENTSLEKRVILLEKEFQNLRMEMQSMKVELKPSMCSKFFNHSNYLLNKGSLFKEYCFNTCMLNSLFLQTQCTPFRQDCTRTQQPVTVPSYSEPLISTLGMVTMSSQVTQAIVIRHFLRSIHT